MLQCVSRVYLHVDQAKHLDSHMGIHLKHLIEFAHLKQHGAVKVSCLELPPTDTMNLVKPSGSSGCTANIIHSQQACSNNMLQ